MNIGVKIYFEVRKVVFGEGEREREMFKRVMGKKKRLKSGIFYAEILFG